MLDGINNNLIELLLQRRYGGDESQVPVVDYLSAKPSAPVLPQGIVREESAGSVTLQLGKSLPAVGEWLKFLAGSELNWLHALISSTTVIQGSSYVNNPLRRLLIPRPRQKIVITHSNNAPASLTIYGAARSYGVHQLDFKAVEIVYDAAKKNISMSINEECRGVSVPLEFQFIYKPEMGFAPIHEVAEGRNTRIREFYWKLWYGDDEKLPAIDVHETFVGPKVTIDANEIERFCAIVGNQGEVFKTARTEKVQAPMDFAIITGWQVCLLFSPFFGLGR